MLKLPICTPFLLRRDPRSLLWWWNWKHYKQYEKWSQEPRSGWQQRELLEVLCRSSPTTTEGIEEFTAQGRQEQRWFVEVSMDVLDTAVLIDCLGSWEWGCSAFLNLFKDVLVICFMGSSLPLALYRLRFLPSLAEKAGYHLQIFISVGSAFQFSRKLRIQGYIFLWLLLWYLFGSPTLLTFQVTLCFSPVGNKLRVRSRKFPAIVNCTAIDWFHEWPQQALESVSLRFLQNTEGIEVRGKRRHSSTSFPPQGTRNSMSRILEFKFKLR